MAAVSQDLVVEAGADWDLLLTYRSVNPDGTLGGPINVAGFTLVVEVRFNSQVATDAPVFSVSTSIQGSIAPEIVISSPADGEFTLHVPASRTAQLPPNSWTKSFSGSPNTHYTARVFSGSGAERFAVTGSLTIRPA